jgi:hypothetical protein
MGVSARVTAALRMGSISCSPVIASTGELMRAVGSGKPSRAYIAT